MSKKNDGGPAFPMPWIGDTPPSSGMTLRDWFAGQALAGMMADHSWLSALTKTFPAGERVPASAQAAYEFADAMIAEREKEQN